MSATSSIIFYPADWLADPNLQECSLAAHGLWMHMLCVMVEADRKGFLEIAGKPLPVDRLARRVKIPFEECEALLRELELWEVFSRDLKGGIYSRRIVRAHKKTLAATKNGKAGAEAKKLKNNGVSDPLKQNVSDRSQASSTSTSTSPRLKDKTPSGNPTAESSAKPPPPRPVEEEIPRLELTPPPESKTSQRERAVAMYQPVAQLCGWVTVARLTSAREKALDATLKRLGLDGWEGLLERAASLKFFDCTKAREGKHANWRPDFDFFVSETKANRILEGKYDRYGRDTESLHALTGGARLAAFTLLGGLDRQGGPH